MNTLETKVANLKPSSKNAILSWGDNDNDDNSNDDNSYEAFYDLCEELTDLMHKVNPSNNWYCEVTNFGWMKQNGHTEFITDKGRAFLNKVLPHTNNDFYVHEIELDGKPCIAIQNFHHDSPTGDEWYYCRQAE